MSNIVSGVGPQLIELGDADLLVLWAMRRWLTARRAGEAAEFALAEPFRLGHMPDGPRLLDDVMTRVAVSACRPMTFGCVHCAVVSPDENLLLGAFRLVQAQRPSAALNVLHDAITCSAVSAVGEAMQPFVDCLETAGLSLARRAVLTQVHKEQFPRLAGAR